MKISQINAYPADGRTQVNIVVDSELSVAEALSSVLALFAPKPDYDLLFQGSHLVGAKPAETESLGDARAYIARKAAEAQTAQNIAHAKAMAAEGAKLFQAERDAEAAAQAEANVVDEPAPKATRTRRPRAATTSTDAATEAKAIDAELHSGPEKIVGDAPVEGRRRTRVTAEAPVETVKTITDADLARACSNAAAIVGIEVVQAVVNDFSVKNMQELAPDVRERFLSELDDEIKLAKEEFARAGK